MAKVLHWLLPKEKEFFHMLKEHSSNVVKGVEELKNLVFNFNKLSYSKKEESVERIKGIENDGDEITHNIIGILDNAFITPIDKEDIHQLTILLDDVIDFIHASAERLLIFRIDRVDSYTKNLAKVAEEIVKKTDQGILEMSKLTNMNKYYIDVHTLENKGDDIYHEALSKLFDNKDPIHIIKYKEIYEFLESVIDKCEVIANVIESVVVKHG